MYRRRMVRPKYALIAKLEDKWIVTSRFPDLESCEKARKDLVHPAAARMESACVPITDPRVIAYYEMVNRERRRRRLRMLRPDELIAWPPKW
ncbi:hypothetical protein D6D85_06135 [Candidatus Methanodesulfokora washburnensis]|uniref:Uncharacterized protein n=2 Tax=Candidatus Methanodesulfokora washburnensis TaxID=2478471 RepID=A0A3R9QYY2_9CREN|nr:hypothetical protein D6D85_06135 [Candidatus Methanodesulfokores washburnensis]